MKKYYQLIIFLLFLTSNGCIELTLYNEDPETSGTLIVTTDWSDIRKDIEIPEKYNIAFADHISEEVAGSSHVFQLSPTTEQYLYVYNSPEGMEKDSDIMKIKQEDDEHIICLPDRFFSSVQEVSLSAGDTSYVTAKMQRQTGMISIIVDIKKGNTDMISGLYISLEGMAEGFDLKNKSVIGKATLRGYMEEENNTYIIHLRTFGIAKDAKQILHLHIIPHYGEIRSCSSDITSILANYNSNKKEDWELKTSLFLSEEGDFSSMILEWIKQKVNIDTN